MLNSILGIVDQTIVLKPNKVDESKYFTYQIVMKSSFL